LDVTESCDNVPCMSLLLDVGIAAIVMEEILHIIIVAGLNIISFNTFYHCILTSREIALLTHYFLTSPSGSHLQTNT